MLPIQLFRLGYLKSDPILAQYRDKLGTRAGRAILEAKSNVVIVADTASSLEKLQRYIDTETLEAMGVSAAEGHAPGDALRPPSLGAIAARENIHFYLMTFARMSRIPMSGSEEQGVSDKYYPGSQPLDRARGDRGRLESEYKRINEFVQQARQTGGEEWPVPDGERTLSPAQQKNSPSTSASSARRRTGTSKCENRNGKGNLPFRFSFLEVVSGPLSVVSGRLAIGVLLRRIHCELRNRERIS